jgi:hypothetical protein
MHSRPFVTRIYQIAGFELLRVKVTHAMLSSKPCVVLEEAGSSSGSRLSANFEHIASSYCIELMAKRLHPWHAPMQFVQTRREQAPGGTYRRVYERVDMAFERGRYSRGRWQLLNPADLRFSATESTAGWWSTLSPS